jgi:hypothetical protein
MTELNEIGVSSTLKGNRLSSTVTVPKRLRKYFNSFRLFARYDVRLRADISILNIPLVSTILPLAWLTRTDVHVERLDRKYVEAMNIIKHELNRFFPRGRFTANIVVDDLVENKIRAQGTAMLFSGGVDSTYSLIRNVSLKPKLVMFFGVVGYQLDLSYKEHNQIVKKTYSDFAEREGLDISFVETNIIGILNDARIAHDFHRVLRGNSLWDSLQLPLVLLGLPAPLSIGRFDRLLIADDASLEFDYYRYPYASQLRINEKFAWADLRVTHDGYINRFRKTGLIKEHLNTNKYLLRVCNDPPRDGLNCSTCEKCARTIVPLILEGVDPNSCGFTVNRSTSDAMRRNLQKKEFEGWREVRWKEIQNLIPHKTQTDLCGSQDFVMWLRNLDIDSVRKKRNLQKDLSNALPYLLAVLYNTFYHSVRDRSAWLSINALLASFLKRKAKNFA